MKSRTDLVAAWVGKAESDLTNLELCLAHERALDTACFHAQQAAEKYLKAYLIAVDREFPLVHNLEKLIQTCAEQEPRFLELLALGQELTPYAVELRYDADFAPTLETAEAARDAAQRIKALVLDCLPQGMHPKV